jgi:tetratricopeptide (TPR) repeat protein
MLAIIIKPDYYEAYLMRGSVLKDLKFFNQSLVNFDRAIFLKHDYAEAYSNRGNVLYELKLFKEALASYNQAIKFKEDYAEAFYNRGICLYKLKYLYEALESYKLAIKFKKDYAVAYSNLGNLLKEFNFVEEALLNYERAIVFNPSLAEAYSNRGNVLKDLKRLKEAFLCYDQALEIESCHNDAHWNKSIALLLAGNFEKGFIEYEFRWLVAENGLDADKRSFTQPLWLGKESIFNKTILLWSEQGLGDTLHFCRYAKLVDELGANVILQVQKPLLKLLQNLAGVSQLVAKGTALPDFDFHCPLLSLPLAFKTRIRTIPNTIPYVKANSDKIKNWNNKLGFKTRPRLGIVWSSVSSFKEDSSRSISFQQMLSAIPVEKFEIVCLQKEIKVEDKSYVENSDVKFYGNDFEDFCDTAALIECMDLVVSTCTSVPHLSAALGKPNWIMIKYSPDWRWMFDRTDSPWYPTVKLYRQETRGEWSTVFENVYSDLQRLML